jgi:hypothetical protein
MVKCADCGSLAGRDKSTGDFKEALSGIRKPGEDGIQAIRMNPYHEMMLACAAMIANFETEARDRKFPRNSGMHST